MKGRVVHSLNIKPDTVVHIKGEETRFLNSNTKRKYNENVNTFILNIPIKSLR